MNRADDQLTQLFERSFPEQAPGDELWESTRTSMRRKVRARRAMVLASVVLAVATATALPQVLIGQQSTDLEFVDTPPEEHGDAEPEVSHTEKPLYVTPVPRRDRSEDVQAREDTTPRPSPSRSPQPADAQPGPTPTTAPSAMPSTPPALAPAPSPEPEPTPSQPPAEPPITFTSHRSGDRVPVGEVTVAGESCTYEAMVELTLVAPDGSRTTTNTMSTDACRGAWQHTFALTSPGEWTVIAAASDGSGGEAGPPYQTSLTLVAF